MRLLWRCEKLAGNEKSGNVIAFRMTENELSRSIDSFRDEYGDGSRGMVTWAPIDPSAKPGPCWALAVLRRVNLSFPMCHMEIKIASICRACEA